MFLFQSILNKKAIVFLISFPVGLALILIGVAIVQQGGIYLPFAGSAKISFDQAEEIARKQIPKDANFTELGASFLHISSDGTIHEAGNQDHYIYWSTKTNCTFNIKPSDGKDHFVYVVTFTNEKVAFVVIIEDQTGEILDTKIMPADAVHC